MSEGQYYPRLSPLQTGLRGRCPRCGRGALYYGFLTLAAACEVCGLDYSRADPGDGPAVFLILILGAVVVPLAFWLESSLAPPYWVHLAIWPLVIIGGALLLLRAAKGILIALQYRNKAGELRDSGDELRF